MKKLNYEIIDDYLPHDAFFEIQNYMLGEKSLFPWYYNHCVTSEEDAIFSLNHHQFTHTFYDYWKPSSSYINLLEPIIIKIKPKCIERIKSNLNLVTSDKVIYPWHTDYDSLNPYAKTAIYYVNTNNGVTILSDNTEIKSVANRLLIFDQNINHTGTTCTDQKVRCLINFNYIDNI